MLKVRRGSTGKGAGWHASTLSGSDPAEEEIPVLTKDILFGMNVLTLMGFLVMGLSGRRYSGRRTGVISAARIFGRKWDQIGIPFDS